MARPDWLQNVPERLRGWFNPTIPRIHIPKVGVDPFLNLTVTGGALELYLYKSVPYYLLPLHIGDTLGDGSSMDINTALRLFHLASPTKARKLRLPITQSIYLSDLTQAEIGGSYGFMTRRVKVNDLHESRFWLNGYPRAVRATTYFISNADPDHYNLMGEEINKHNATLTIHAWWMNPVRIDGGIIYSSFTGYVSGKGNQHQYQYSVDVHPGEGWIEVGVPKVGEGGNYLPDSSKYCFDFAGKRIRRPVFEGGL
ncbi:hypothetical protein HY612_02645 [Candidatus Roizmanbacteria bacterium]|nr:hypothetical protein [Candidatus Roizmanbacteria bacterium]